MAINRGQAKAKTEASLKTYTGGPKAQLVYAEDTKHLYVLPDGNGSTSVQLANTSDVSAVDAKVTTAQNTANAAQSAASTAQTTADAAKTAASTAQQAASTAQNAANSAQTTAESKAPMYTYSQTDLTAGTSALETGKLYFVYE